MRGRKKISVFEYDSAGRTLALRSTSPGVTFNVINNVNNTFETIPAQQDVVTVELNISGPTVLVCPDNVRVHFMKPGEVYAPKEDEDEHTT